MSEQATYVNPFELKLLDWFAGCALIGLVTKHGAAGMDDSADDAFVIAREMLKARAGHVPREGEEPAKGWAP